MKAPRISMGRGKMIVEFFLWRTPSPSMKAPRISMGRGKMIVEFFSAEMEFRVCKYLSCNAAGEVAMISAASFKALLDFCSPSAAITLALASRVASASAAMERCICWGRRTSLISILSTCTPQGSVAASRALCMESPIDSLSDRISDRFFVPRTFLKVVAASSLGVGYLVVHHGVHADSHGVPGQDLLRGHVKSSSPEVHTPVVVNTGDYEEQPRTLGSP